MDEATIMILKTLQEMQRDLGSITSKNDSIDANVNILRTEINQVDQDLDMVRDDLTGLKSKVHTLIEHYQAKEGGVELNIEGNVDGSVNTGTVGGGLG